MLFKISGEALQVGGCAENCATLLFLAPTCIRRGKSCATEGACAGTDVESEEREIHTQVEKKEMNTQRPVQTRKRKLIPVCTTIVFWVLQNMLNTV